MLRRSRAGGIGYKRLGVLVVAFALLATACSEEESESSSLDTTASSSQTALSGVSIAASSVEEMDVLRFDGLNPEDDLSDVELSLLVDDLDPIELLMFADDLGVFAVTPLHPSAPGVGGDVTFRLTAANNQIREFDVPLTGLPKSPGAWDDAIDSLLAELESRAAQLGMTLSEISGEASSGLGDDAAAIKFIADFLDDGSDEDLESLLVRSGAELPSDQVELVDSIVAKLGLGHMNLPPLDLQEAEAMAWAEELGISAAGDSQVTAVRAGLAQGTSCRKKIISIRSGTQLQRELAKGIEAQNALKDGFFSDSSDYVVSNGLMLTGMAAGAFAATGVGAPAAGVVAGVGTVAGAMYATQRLALLVDAGSYPTSFTSLTVETSQPDFNEDFKTDGQVTEVDVVAAATGLDAAQALAGLGAAIADGALGAATGGLAAGKRAEEVLGGTMGMSGQLRGTAQAKVLEAAAGDYFKICPQQWTVSINNSKYIRAWTTDGNAEVDDGSFAHRPLKVGADTLWIETLPSAFPGASAITDTALNTNRLEIDADPEIVKVKRAGDIIDIAVMLENADTTTLWWESEQGEWNDNRGNASNDASPRPLKTPTDKDLYPFDIIVEATSDTGLREGATDERTVKIRVQLRDLIVTPDPGGVLINNTLQFTATDDEGNPREVTWTATGGSIDGSGGLYTAGGIPGTYSVTATATDDLSVSETVAVNVVDQCLVGTWLLRSQEFFEQVGAQAGGQTQYRSGESRLVIREDGTYTTFREAWSFEVVTEEASIIGVIDAANSGTWQATDVEMIIEEIGGDEESVQLFIEIGGQLQSIPGVGNQYSFASDSFSGQFPYTCDANVMTSTASGVTSTFDRADG